jgi:MFS family permease
VIVNGVLAKINSIYKSESKVSRFLATLLLTGLGAGLYKGIQDNYLAELVHITEFQRGIVEFFRELPGLMVIVVLAALSRLSESKIFKLGTGLMALGMAGLLISGTGRVIVVGFMVLYSLGEHVVMPVRSTISLELAQSEKAGASLGITSGLAFVGNILGYFLVAVTFALFTRAGYGRSTVPGVETHIAPFKTVFALSAAVLIAAALVGLSIKETGNPAPRRKWYFNRKFHKYYMLEVFYGARKQIFLTFAPYVLILEYGASATVISMLMAICAACCIVASPIVGKIIDILGYKFIMVTDTLLLVPVCLCYGFAHRIFSPKTAFIIVCANYVLDAIISLASMASNIYARDVSDNQAELTATLSTGISVNHLISVSIALLGGFIWKFTGIEVLFSLSAFLGILNSIYAATIKTGKRAA